MSWKVPLSSLDGLKKDGLDVSLPYIDPKDFVRYLLEKTPDLLLGGASFEMGEKHLKTFWENYRSTHPTHDIFQDQNHSYRTLSNSIPLAFHGDEGRGTKKGNTCILMFEAVLGLMDSKTHNKFSACDECYLGESVAKRFELCEGYASRCKHDPPLCTQQVANYKYHSFLTKFVVGVLPNDYYKNTSMLEKLLSKLCASFRELFEDGVTLSNGQRFFVCIVGFKGDLKWFEKVGRLQRCFNRQLKIGEPMCHECLAGSATAPFEDYKEDPSWGGTMYERRPWSESNPPTEILQVPFENLQGQRARPEMLLRRDCFHNTKVGLYRDFIGSAVLLLCSLGYFHVPRTIGKNNRPTLLERAHGHFRLFCHSTGRTPALRSFTTIFFNALTKSDFGWINCKGSDTSHCMAWLCTLTSGFLFDLKSPDHRTTIETIHETAVRGREFLNIMYSHGLWLPRHCAAAMHQSLHCFLAGYNRLAFLSMYKHSFTGFGMKSKFHMLAHTKIDLSVALRSGTLYIINPLVFCCETNEDVVGRVSRLSRRVSPKLPSQRTLQLYLIKCKAVYGRYRKTKNVIKRLKVRVRDWRCSVGLKKSGRLWWDGVLSAGDPG